MKNKRLSPTTSAAIIGGNDDLLMEIMVLLPIKVLARFHLVIEHWRPLICSPEFHRRHTNNHRHKPKPQPCFILSTATKPRQFFNFNPTLKVLVPFSFKAGCTRILQSSNGLLLIEEATLKHRKYYYVCNPTTGQSRMLILDSDDINRKGKICGLFLAFDPSRSSYYKVVSMRRSGDWLDKYRFHVFSSESGAWKFLGERDGSVDATFHHKGFYWNNRIYFIRSRADSFFLDLENGRLQNLPAIAHLWINE